MFTIYTYYNGADLATMLNGVVMIFGDASFSGLLKTAAICGFLALMVGVAAFGKIDGLGSWFIGMFIGITAAFGIKVNVAIVDNTGVAPYTTTVSNVPWIIGVVYPEITHFGKYLTEKYELYFIPPGAPKFTRYGIAFGQSMAKQIVTARTANQRVRSNLSAIGELCVLPAFMRDPNNIQTFFAMTSPWDWLKTSPDPYNAVRPVEYIDSTGASTTVSCKEAIDSTQSDYQNSSDGYQADQNALFKSLAMLTDGGVTDPTVVQALTADMPGLAANLLNKASGGQLAALENAIVSNAVMDSVASAADKFGSSELSRTIANTMAMNGTMMTSRVQADLAERTLPVLRNTVERVVIGIFPFVLLMMLLSGGALLSILKSWFTAALWVQMWAPLYAMLAGIMWSTSRIPGITNGNYSPSDVSQVVQASLSEQDMAGLLSLSIPVLAYMLVKGGEMMMSSLVSSMTSPAASEAQRRADAAADGSLSAGNINWGNRSMNNASMNKGSIGHQYDEANSMALGSGMRMGWGGGSTRFDTGGMTSSTPQFKPVVDAGVSAATEKGLQSSIAESTQITQGIGSDIQKGFSHSNSSGIALSNDVGTRSTYSAGTSGAVNHSVDAAKKATEDVSRSSGFDMNASAGLVAAATQGATPTALRQMAQNIAEKSGINLKNNPGATAKVDEASKLAYRFGQDSSVKEGIQQAYKAGHDETASTSGTTSNRSSSGDTDSASSGSNAFKRLQSALQGQEQWTDAQRNSASIGARIQGQMDPYMVQAAGGGAALASLMQRHNAGDSNASQQLFAISEQAAARALKDNMAAGAGGKLSGAIGLQSPTGNLPSAPAQAQQTISEASTRLGGSPSSSSPNIDPALARQVQSQGRVGSSAMGADMRQFANVTAQANAQTSGFDPSKVMQNVQTATGQQVNPAATAGQVIGGANTNLSEQFKDEKGKFKVGQTTTAGIIAAVSAARVANNVLGNRQGGKGAQPADWEVVHDKPSGGGSGGQPKVSGPQNPQLPGGGDNPPSGKGRARRRGR